MTKTIPLAAIDATDRLRPVDPDHAALIAASIEEKGLLQPIVVRPRDGGYVLTAGAHRLRALAELGWTELTVGEHVVVQDKDELDARLDEIDENLARHELNALDRAFFFKERQRVYDERAKLAGRGGDRKSAKFKQEINFPTWEIDPRFSEDVKEKLGVSKTTVYRWIDIADKLDGQAVEAIRGTRIARIQSELLSLIQFSADDQIKIASAIKEGRAHNVHTAMIATKMKPAPREDDRQARVLANLISNWDVASKPTRAAFEEYKQSKGARK